MHVAATQRQLATVLIFSGAYILAAAVAAWSLGNSEFIFYIAVMAVIAIGLMAVHRRIGISAGLLWCLSVWGLMHMAGGLIPIPSGWHDDSVGGVLYNFRFPPGGLKYDQVTHAYGFAIATWLCWQALSARTRSDDGNPLRPTPGLMVLCAAAGMGLGALNEVIEFIATLTLAETNVGGYVNTGWDLVANFVGSVVAVVLIFLRKDV